MRRALAIIACSFLFTPSTRSGELILPDGTPLSGNGGLIILRQGGQATVSLGGALLPRKVKVISAGPEGPVVTRFTLPSVFHSPVAPAFPVSSPAFLRVEIPDPHGLLYIEGELIRTYGTVRHLECPPLPPGMAYPVRLRAAFKVGDQFLIEDKPVVLRAGEGAAVTFDGSRAVSISLRADGPNPGCSRGKTTE